MKDYETLVRRLLMRFGSDGDPSRIAARLAQAAPRLQGLRVPRELALGVLARSLCLESARRPPSPPVPDELAVDLQAALEELPPAKRLLFARRFMDRRPLAHLGGAAALRRIVQALDASLDLDRSPCPSDSELLGLQGNLLDAAEQAGVEPHVEGCDDCLARARALRDAVERLHLARPPDCPDPLDLLARIATKGAIAHLAECADCRLKLEEVPVGRPARPAVWAGLGIAVAALAALVLGFLLSPRPPPPKAAAIEELRGELRLFRGGSWIPVPADSRILDGESLRWADTVSEALVRLPDGSELLVAGPAEIEFRLGPDAHRIRIASGIVWFRAGATAIFAAGPHLIRPSEVSLGRIEVGKDSTRLAIYRGSAMAAHSSEIKPVESDQEAFLHPAGTISGPWTSLARPREILQRWAPSAEDVQRVDFDDLPDAGRPDGWAWPRGEAGGVERAGTNRFYQFPEEGGGPALFGAVTGHRIAAQADVRSGPGGRLLIGIQTNFGHAIELGPDHVRILRVRWTVAVGGRGRFQTFEAPLAISAPDTLRPGEWYGVALEAVEGPAGRTLRARWWPLADPWNVTELEAVDRNYRTGAFSQAQAGVWSPPGASLAVDNLYWR
jgi:hypothetical protein